MWAPVEFNLNQFCWVEICWITDGPGNGYWQAYRPAQQILGLDITAVDYNTVTKTWEALKIPDMTPSRPTSTPQASFKLCDHHCNLSH